jgi:hypothetical protein
MYPGMHPTRYKSPMTDVPIYNYPVQSVTDSVVSGLVCACHNHYKYSHSTVLASTFLFQLIGDQSWRRTVEVKVRYIVWLPLYDMGNTQF